jgi:hypothetical protein
MNGLVAKSRILLQRKSITPKILCSQTMVRLYFALEEGIAAHPESHGLAALGRGRDARKFPRLQQLIGFVGLRAGFLKGIWKARRTQPMFILLTGKVTLALPMRKTSRAPLFSGVIRMKSAPGWPPSRCHPGVFFLSRDLTRKSESKCLPVRAERFLFDMSMCPSCDRFQGVHVGVCSVVHPHENSVNSDLFCLVNSWHYFIIMHGYA